MEPNFEPVLPLQPSDLSSKRITDVMGTDYNLYIHCRASDAKAISYLIGKSADRVSVDWGRSVVDRPRADRSSDLYRTGTRKAKDTPKNDPKDEKKCGPPISECGEDELRNDLYLSPSDDDDAAGVTFTPNNGSQRSTQESHQETPRGQAATQPVNANSSTGIRDLSYWVKKGEKLEKKAPQPSSQTEHKSRGREEKASTTPKSIESGGNVDNYRDLLKNGLDSLSSNAPALRSGRMLSVLNDTDDEGPVERKEWQPPTAEAKTYGEWKRRHSRPQERAPSGFVDRKVLEQSPKREQVSYEDMDPSEGSSDLSEEVKPKMEPATDSKRKEKSLNKHSSDKRPRPKNEPKNEVTVERFRFERGDGPFHIAFPVPSHSASPSHRKRQRRHDAIPDCSRIPGKKPPVHSPNSDRLPMTDVLASTGGFDMASSPGQSPATDPMVDPNFERNLSDVESEHEAPPPRSPAEPMPTPKAVSKASNQVQPPSCLREPDPDRGVSPCRLPSQSPARGDRSQGPFLPDTTASDLRSTLIKSEPEKKPSSIFQTLPKIPRKRPTSTEVPDPKKKPRMAFDTPPVKQEEMPPKDTTKLKESKKNRHKFERKSKISEPIKREPSSPRAAFEMSVMDEPQSGVPLINGDSLAPSLPRVGSTAAELIEVATQTCELLPAADRDANEMGTKRLRAVAFRIEGGRGKMSAAEARAAANSEGSTLTRRGSSASTLDESEGPRSGHGDEADEARAAARSADHLDAVIRHKYMQESLVQRENQVYQKMNAVACFSDALDKKVEADRLKTDCPARFSLCALRACLLYIQACYVEERQSKNESASMHYRETVTYVRSTSQLIEQVAKSTASQAEPHAHRARLRHHFITLLCAQMKAIINYRVYSIAHRDTARIRPEVERDLHRVVGSQRGGASERSTPESITRSPAVSAQGGVHLSGESLHRVQRYFRHSLAVQVAHEYWLHAITLRQKHEELSSIEEMVFRKSQVICYGPECPVPCFLRYLNTFLTLCEENEL